MINSRQAVSLLAGVGTGLALAWAAVTTARAGAVPRSHSPPEVIADSLIGLWIDSVGGMATYDRFQTATYTITTVLFDTLTGRVRRSRPRYVWIKKGPYGEETRVERWEAYGFVAQGFNGREDWAELDGVALPDTARDRQEVRYVAGDLSYWPGLPFKLTDDGVFLRYEGLGSRPGAEFRPNPAAPLSMPRRNGYHAVSVSFGEGVGDKQDAWVYYFKPGEGFPTEVTYLEQGQEILNRVIWGPTFRTGRIQYPVVQRRDWITTSGKRTKALVISDMIVNAEIPQAVFERR